MDIHANPCEFGGDLQAKIDYAAPNIRSFNYVSSDSYAHCQFENGVGLSGACVQPGY
jgi:hypothetical protein